MSKKIITAVAAVLMCVSFVSCSNSKKTSESKVSENSATDNQDALPTDEDSVESSSEIGERESFSHEKGETTSESIYDNAEATTVSSATETTAPAVTEASTMNQPTDSSGGYTSDLDIAQDFYNAYLSHDPEKVYSMFDQDEMKKYAKLVESELEGKSADEVFSKQAVTKAIGASMDSIGEIMKAYSDSEGDKWLVTITSEDMEKADDKSLESFNGDLNTSYSAAVIINYIFYNNESNGESFTGNSSAFLEKNGKWYLSYSSLMQSELLNYLEV
ncbi:MAG: hypothetical protein NC485_07470 [Ruminococcus flavefaciens]|nr:hypothetical protein [Ruminococcus flavefaciens]